MAYAACKLTKQFRLYKSIHYAELSSSFAEEMLRNSRGLVQKVVNDRTNTEILNYWITLSVQVRLKIGTNRNQFSSVLSYQSIFSMQ